MLESLVILKVRISEMWYRRSAVKERRSLQRDIWLWLIDGSLVDPLDDLDNSLCASYIGGSNMHAIIPAVAPSTGEGVTRPELDRSGDVPYYPY